MRAKNDRWLA